MDFNIRGSNDWKDDEFSNSLHEQLFGHADLNSGISENTARRKKGKVKRKQHELKDKSTHCDNTRDVCMLVVKDNATEVTKTVNDGTLSPKKKNKKKKKKIKSLGDSLATEEESTLLHIDTHCDNTRDVCMPVVKDNAIEVTKTVIDRTLPPSPKKKSKKKKKKIKSLGDSLATEEESKLSNNAKQFVSKSKLLQSKQDGDDVRTKDTLPTETKSKKFIIGKESFCEISEVVPCSEQTISEFRKMSKRKKHKRKHDEEPLNVIFNKRQKQEEKESSVSDSKDKVFGTVKTHLLNPTKLQHIFSKYDTSTEKVAQKTDSQKSGSSILKEKAMKRLEAAKFRFLNEKMYTVTGSEALQYFRNDPDAFEEYHSGYQSQVKKWPVNPVDLIIGDLQKKPKSFVIADLGCGDAKIARVLSNRTVHSFDLVVLNDKVVCCDISKVPLGNESVDVAVFCLSLMGTNLADYILESHRILKDGGLLKVAEVESRIKDIDAFVMNFGKYGFQLVSKDTQHKMFVLMDFRKVVRKVKKSKLPTVQMDPCIYKKR